MSLENLPAALHPSWSPLAKTKFSMARPLPLDSSVLHTNALLQVLPEVEASLKEWGTESVVIFGIEVGLLHTP